jgi:hypothetical protein
MVMYLAHPPNVPSDGGGIGSRVIRIRLQFGQIRSRLTVFMACKRDEEIVGYTGYGIDWGKEM